MQNDLTQEGIAAYQAGNIAEARRLLAQAVKTEKTNETAWYYFSRTQTDINKRRDCLRMVLKINPQHADAQRELAALSGGSSAQSTVSEDLEDLTSTPSIAPLVKTVQQTAVNLMTSIPGAPQQITVDDLQSFARELVQDSMTVVLGESSSATAAISTSWWRILLTIAIGGLVIGLIGDLTQVIQVLQYAYIGARLNLFALLFSPILMVITALIGVLAGSFASHWYITTQHNAKASLLEHSAMVTRVWTPISIGLAVIALVATLFGGGVASLEVILLTGFGLLSGAVWVFTLVAGAFTLYGMSLMVRGFKRVYTGIPDNYLWLTALIMAVITALVF